MADDDSDPSVVPIDPDLSPSDPAEPSIGHRPTLHRGGGQARPAVLAAIALGGALGSPARYGLGRLITVSAGGFPWDVFWANITGSLVLGFSLVLIIERLPPSRFLRPFFAVGFLGAYTTYSTYMVGASVLVEDGHTATAIAYLLGSAFAGFAAVWLGIIGARLLPVTARRTPRVEPTRKEPG